MPRLPASGSDNGTWGGLLNDFLTVEHVPGTGDLKIRSDGTLAAHYVRPQPDGFHKESLIATVQTSLDTADNAVHPHDSRLADPRTTIKKSNSAVGTAKNLNLMEGSRVALIASNNGSDAVDVTVIDGTSLSGPTIEDETVPLPARGKLSFQGSNVEVIDNPANNRTIVNLHATNFIIQKDGAAITRRPTLDIIGDSRVVEDLTGNRIRVHVRREYFSVTDPRVGVVMNGLGDQGAKLQAALNLADTGGRYQGTLFIPPGVVECRQELVSPTGRWTRILGSGAGEGTAGGVSVIYFPVDLGAGKYALKPSRWIDKLTLVGPGEGATTPYGQLPAQMYGIYSANGANYKDIRVTGFGAGLGVRADHQEWHNCDLRGNGYGMDWIDNAFLPDGNGGFNGGLGDHFIDCCDFRDQTRASIGLSDSATIANARITHSKFGNAPFAVYRYAGQDPPRNTTMSGIIFDSGAIENCGNAVIYDEPSNGSWENIIFDNTREAGTFSGPLWPGKPTDLASIDVNEASRIVWRGCSMPIPTNRYQFAGKQVSNIRSDGIDLVPFYAGNAKPVFIRPAGIGNIECDGVLLGAGRPGTGAPSVSFKVASEAISKGDVIEMHGYSHVRRYRGSGSSLNLGVSLHNVSLNEVCFYAIGGALIQVANKTTGIISSGSLIVPDPSNFGGIKAAGGQGDMTVFGRVTGGDIAAGAIGQASISL